jgi:hypothetical protein
MVGLFAAVIWAGYGIGSYGWVMVKGYDIPASAWFNPVNPFQWSSNPGMVPKGQVFPGQAPGSGSGNTGVQSTSIGQQVFSAAVHAV